jgi:hypothetical protein
MILRRPAVGTDADGRGVEMGCPAGETKSLRVNAELSCGKSAI